MEYIYVCPENTYPAVKTLLKHLLLPNTFSNKEPPNLMSLAANRESWKIVKENMSAQVSHIGMYKAAALHPLLGCIFHKKSEIPYLSEYSLRRHP